LLFTTEEAKPGTTVFMIHSDGTGLRELGNFSGRKAIAVWTPDGAHVAVQVLEGDQQDEFFLLSVDGSEAPIEVTGLPDSWFPWYWPLWGGME